MLSDSGSFDIEALAGVLAVHQVECVVIGGVAALLHGSDLSTSDFDLVPSSNRDNLLKLTNALVDLEAAVVQQESYLLCRTERG